MVAHPLRVRMYGTVCYGELVLLSLSRLAGLPWNVRQECGRVNVATGIHTTVSTITINGNANKRQNVSALIIGKKD